MEIKWDHLLPVSHHFVKNPGPTIYIQVFGNRHKTAPDNNIVFITMDLSRNTIVNWVKNQCPYLKLGEGKTHGQPNHGPYKFLTLKPISQLPRPYNLILVGHSNI